MYQFCSYLIILSSLFLFTTNSFAQTIEVCDSITYINKQNKKTTGVVTYKKRRKYQIVYGDYQNGYHAISKKKRQLQLLKKGKSSSKETFYTNKSKLKIGAIASTYRGPAVIKSINRGWIGLETINNSSSIKKFNFALHDILIEEEEEKLTVDEKQLKLWLAQEWLLKNKDKTRNTFLYKNITESNRADFSDIEQKGIKLVDGIYKPLLYSSRFTYGAIYGGNIEDNKWYLNKDVLIFHIKGVSSPYIKDGKRIFDDFEYKEYYKIISISDNDLELLFVKKESIKNKERPFDEFPY